MTEKTPITLGIHMLAKDAGSCIVRALDSVAPLFVELVLIDDRSSDDTIQLATDWCATNNVTLRLVQISPETHPDLYLVDTPETFQPLAGCTIPGPFSGHTVLCNFGEARNLGWDAATTEWILWLDSDDVVLNKDVIPDTIMRSAALDMRQVYAKYTSHGKDAVRSSFTKRGAARWIGNIHESLSEIKESALSPVSITDMADSKRRRIANHYLKAAWLSCQRAGLESADVNEIACVVQDLYWIMSAAYQPLLEVLRRRAPDSRVLEFVENALGQDAAR